MRNTILAAAAGCAFCATVFAAGPFEAFKGKMKEGQYETTMEMEMPGMPPGMGKQQMKNQHCVTNQDIEGGKMGKGEMPKGCEVKNFKMSGNTASYTTVCTGEREMTSDANITFTDNGYKMDMKTAMKQGGQTMNMTQRMESRYLGPCKK